MKTILSFILFIVFSCACNNHHSINTSDNNPLIGTWQLLSGTLIQGNDTVVTNYNQNISFIKIINPTHFAFLQHDLHKGKDSNAVFVAGGGNYTLKGNLYTEHLAYCSDRNWEDNDFTFTVELHHDTLIQKGNESIPGTNTSKVNIEKYVRLK